MKYGLIDLNFHCKILQAIQIFRKIMSEILNSWQYLGNKTIHNMNENQKRINRKYSNRVQHF